MLPPGPLAAPRVTMAAPRVTMVAPDTTVKITTLPSGIQSVSTIQAFRSEVAHVR